MNQEERAELCATDKAREQICTSCAKEYSKNEPYKDPLAVSIGKCYICEDKRIVGPSYSLMGFTNGGVLNDSI